MQVEIVVNSARALKNVNWRFGMLQPYAVVWIDTSRKCSTKMDVSNNMNPVWNEKFTIPLPPTSFPETAVLYIDIVHANPSVGTKPLVGSAQLPLCQILDEARAHNKKVPLCLNLTRPSGRPRGGVEVKVGIKDPNIGQINEFNEQPTPYKQVAEQPVPQVQMEPRAQPQHQPIVQPQGQYLPKQKQQVQPQGWYQPQPILRCQYRPRLIHLPLAQYRPRPVHQPQVQYQSRLMHQPLVAQYRPRPIHQPLVTQYRPRLIHQPLVPQYQSRLINQPQGQYQPRPVQPQNQYQQVPVIQPQNGMRRNRDTINAQNQNGQSANNLNSNNPTSRVAGANDNGDTKSAPTQDITMNSSNTEKAEETNSVETSNDAESINLSYNKTQSISAEVETGGHDYSEYGTTEQHDNGGHDANAGVECDNGGKDVNASAEKNYGDYDANASVGFENGGSDMNACAENNYGGYDFNWSGGYDYDATAFEDFNYEGYVEGDYYVENAGVEDNNGGYAVEEYNYEAYVEGDYYVDEQCEVALNGVGLDSYVDSTEVNY